MTHDTRNALAAGLALLGGRPVAERNTGAENPPPSKPKPAPRTWSLGELLGADFPEPAWVVDGLLPAGLALLAGRPKLGKSFLALQLALAVGAGGSFLGQDVAQGRALYIALEDSPRRLQTRLKDMGAAALDDLSLAFGWPALNAPDGLDALAEAIYRHKLRLVVVDTLARSISGRLDWDELGAVTAMLGGLQELALGANCAVLLVDHHRKAGGLASDVVDDAMGSTGKTAVCDTIWGLYRKRGDRGATLATTGRDIEEAELGIAFDPVTRTWQVDESAQGVRRGTVQDSILALLDEWGGEGTTSELAEALDMPKGNVSRELSELLAKQAVVKGKRQGHGVPYQLPRTNDNLDNNDNLRASEPARLSRLSLLSVTPGDNGQQPEPPPVWDDADAEALTAFWESEA